MLTLWALSSPGLVFFSLCILGLPNQFYPIGKWLRQVKKLFQVIPPRVLVVIQQ